MHWSVPLSWQTASLSGQIAKGVPGRLEWCWHREPRELQAAAGKAALSVLTWEMQRLVQPAFPHSQCCGHQRAIDLTCLNSAYVDVLL